MATRPRNGFSVRGHQFLTRESRAGKRKMQRAVDVDVAEQGVRIQVTGLVSGQSLLLESTDPAVIRHIRDLDRVHSIIHISERDPLPEPGRWPVDGVPDGMQWCANCGGTGEVVNKHQCTVACKVCRGIGSIPDGA